MSLAMVLVPVPYPVFQQPDAVYRHGRTMDGTQRYNCTTCRRTFQMQHRQKIPRVWRKTTAITLIGSGVRGTARGLSISAQTVMGQLKERLTK